MAKNVKMSKKEIKELIYTDLNNQLLKLGKLGKYNEDLISDYIYFWDLKLNFKKILKNIA